MQIKNLMAKLTELGIACSYHGDEDVAFQRLILYPKVVTNGDFVVIVDKSWDPSTRKQFKNRDIRVQINEALKAGVTGFICGSEVAAHSLLQDENVICANSCLELSVGISRVFRDLPDRAMLTVVTGSISPWPGRSLRRSERRLPARVHSPKAPAGCRATVTWGCPARSWHPSCT